MFIFSFLDQAGVVCTIITGVMLSPTKIKTTSDVEMQVTNFWDWLSYTFNTVSFVIPGVIIGLNPVYLTFRNFIFIFIVQIIVCCCRLVSVPEEGFYFSDN